MTAAMQLVEGSAQDDRLNRFAEAELTLCAANEFIYVLECG